MSGMNETPIHGVPVERLKNLDDPFKTTMVQWRVGATANGRTRAMAFPYIESRSVMMRLDRECGKHNWQDLYKSGPSGGVVCGISILVDYGDGDPEWITKWDGASNTDSEGVKGGLSDSFKRAAVKWGIGRYLYYLDRDKFWCDAEPVGNKGCKLLETPRLPQWAVPQDAPESDGGPETTESPETGQKRRESQETGGGDGNGTPADGEFVVDGPEDYTTLYMWAETKDDVSKNDVGRLLEENDMDAQVVFNFLTGSGA